MQLIYTYSPVFLLLLIATREESSLLCEAKKPIRPPPSSTKARVSSSSSSGGRSGAGRATAARSSAQRRRVIVQEEDYDDDDVSMSSPAIEVEEDEEFDEDDILDEESDELPLPLARGGRNPAKRSAPPGASKLTRETATHSSSAAARRKPPAAASRGRFDSDEEGDYERDFAASRPPPRSKVTPPGRRGPPPGQGRGRGPPPGRPGSVVPYGKQPPQQPSFLTKGLETLRSSIPDPETVKNAALTSLKTAKETTSSLSTNIYRDIKGLTSSELEQVMLKATRPDDTPVKGKHVERLVGVTYQISSRYDIYDAVLRKLWSKMAEKDWRTTIKAVYILHRFSADGAPDHAPALKARLRELRRTRDPKRKDKYFNTKQLLAGDAFPENIKFRAFMSRYAHYVLLRAQCFGGMFDEISTLPKSGGATEKRKGGAAVAGPPMKPITSTCLRAEHLEAAAMLLKAGVACQLKDGEECENTAIAAERVASDLIGLCSAVAIALNRALKDSDLKGADPALLKKWCEFYKDELLPKTKAMVKKTTPKLDAYGLFLPSRMGTSVANDLLEKGINLDVETSSTEESAEIDDVQEAASIEKEEDEAKDEEEEDASEAGEVEEEEPAPRARTPEVVTEDEAIDDAAELDDEYEYEEEEYYDDEEY